jgi:hypothetical protein
MDLNIISITYLFLRLAPFVLVCFFSLSSLLNQDFKGLVYLCGLIFASFITIMIGNILDLPSFSPEERPEICNILSINQQGDFSKLPLSQTVFSFTLFYLLIPIIMLKTAKQNIPTLVFFPILILFDIAWNIQNTCYRFEQLFVSLCLGGFIGLSWGYIIYNTRNPSLQYLVGPKNNEVCSKPTKQMFRCKTSKGKTINVLQ